MRTIDDKIVYELNLATPTQSFRSEVDPKAHCADLYRQVFRRCLAMLRYPILAILFPASLCDCPSNLMYALGYLSSTQPLLLAIAFTLFAAG